MLTPILATEDPYLAAALFVRCGWDLFLETPRDSDDRLAGVALGDAQLLLGTDTRRSSTRTPRLTAAPGSRPCHRAPGPHRGPAPAPPRARRDGQRAGEQPWGERAFHATVCGYRFLLAAEVSEEAEPS